MTETNTLFTQPPEGQQFVYIGIDPGSTNGLAVYSKERGLRISQPSFWKLITYMQDKVIPAHKEKRIVVLVILEATYLNKFMYSKRINGKNAGVALATARNVGMNQGCAKLIKEFCDLHEIKVEEFQPGPHDKKWTREFFLSLSGMETAETAEHCRDAARFISRFWLNNINKG